MLINTILPIASQFAATVSEISPLGNGLINDTFLVTTETAPFVLQRINGQVFPKPEQITANLVTINQHIEQKNGESLKLQLPELLNTAANKPFYQDNKGDYWRALSFIANTESLETIGRVEDAKQVGFALGHFHRLLSDIDPQSLHDTLPGFHITPGYLSHYHQALTETRIEADDYCHQFIANFEPLSGDLENAKRQGLLNLRVIHGDPKLNNFLFDKTSRKVVSLIDLDTVKPGLVHYDIGDCLRSCCHIIESGRFDMDICAALLKTYLSEAGAFFSGYDYHYLYPAIRLIPFELGIRFYTDYLEGNRYFKTTEPKQNLRRATEQFRLCQDIMAQESAIQALIASLKTCG
ncbi:MAG: phosphotransferase enzyme family protein [Methylococcaceae bacterium]